MIATVVESTVKGTARKTVVRVRHYQLTFVGNQMASEAFVAAWKAAAG